jgi:hypothetical protein
MMKKKKKKKKKKKTKREARRTSGRIGEVPLVVEIIEADSEVGVVSVVKIEEASVVAGEDSVVAEEAFAVAGGVSVVGSVGDSGIVLVVLDLEGDGVVSGVGVVKEIGEDLGEVLMVQVAREISEVKRSEDSRRRNLSSSEKKRI